MEFHSEFILGLYREGIFPMGDPYTGKVEWYRPTIRAIVPLETFHCPRRLARTVRKRKFEIYSDRDFEGVIDACSDREMTWITPAIRKMFVMLHREGMAHSVEAWYQGKLAGGVYGLRVGGAFMAESMFHRVTDAGKVALVALVNHLRRWSFRLLDIQMVTAATEHFRPVEVPHFEYVRLLEEALQVDPGWGAVTQRVLARKRREGQNDLRETTS